MEEKEFYETEEIDKKLEEIKDNMEVLRGYKKLIDKVKKMKEDKR